MKITVKARFNSSKDSFQKFGPNMYLVYLSFPEDEDSVKILISYLSDKLGVPSPRINFFDKDSAGNWIFDVR
ncbi:MAG: hypothetical protein AABW81_02025 [Nanoarchaeota archaeon]